VNQFRNNIVALALLAAIAALTGCQEPAQRAPREIPYYLSSPQDVHKIGKVVFVEIPGTELNDEIGRDTTAALLKAIQARGLFTLELLALSDPAATEIARMGDQTLSLEQISNLHKRFGSDAAIFGRITSFRSYPHMQMGLRLRMVDLRTAKLLWGVDQIWDTADKDLQDRLEDYFEDQVADEYRPLDWRVVLVSPLALEEFIGYETARTLPSLTPERPSALKSSARNVKRTARDVRESVGNRD
jgi:hypothetical protein